MGRRIVIFPLAIVISLGAGCAQSRRAPAYRTLPSRLVRDIDAARAANERGLNHAEKGRFGEAEEAFRQALQADGSLAAAHNNLGLVLLSKGKLYESAVEFRMASRLRPRAREPVLNLGMLYDTLDWGAAAIEVYEKALALDTDNLETLGRLARCYLSQGGRPEALYGILRTLAEREGEWKAWAVAQIERRQDARD